MTIHSTAENEVIVIDVRTLEEYQQSHIKNCQLIDFYSPDFPSKIASLDKSKTYKLYCRSGNRSGQAVQLMKTLGFGNVENLGSLEQASHILKIECVK